MTIGNLGEKSLHAALKSWYAQPGDLLEAPLAGYHIDILRPTDALPQLIEIQTGNFSSIKTKLWTLLPQYAVRLVYPVPLERQILLIDSETGELLSRRKSPRRGRLEDVFRELVSLTDALTHPHFTLEVLLVKDEELRVNDGRGSWRRKRQSIHDRRLLDVADRRVFRHLADWCALLPDGLPEPFTVSDLAGLAKLQRPLAGKMLYCLRAAGVVQRTGKQGRAYLYRRVEPGELT